MIVKPLPPSRHDDEVKQSNDRAKSGGYSLRALERLMAADEDLWPWRERTHLAHAYYDGESVTDDMVRMAEAYGLKPHSTNLIGAVINVVLGQEEKSRRDPKLEPDEDESSDVADVLQVKLKQAQRETKADQAIGAAYADQVKGGRGWCGVHRPADPRKFRYAVEYVPWQEMSWDRAAKSSDLSDARWQRRAQWKDLDDVLAAYPGHAALLRSVLNDGFASWDNAALEDELRVSYDEYQHTAPTSWFRTRRSEWLDGVRERIRCSEVEYRVPANVTVMKIKGQTIVFDLENETHVAAVERGIVKLERVPTTQIRRAIFAGPYRLSDEPTKLKKFSKVPFTAFTANSDNLPYGLIKGMVAPQDDYNESDMRLRWMLLAQQLIIDEDALSHEHNTIEDVVATMMRPDMVAVLNKNRTNKDALNFRNDFQLQKELFDRMQDRRQMVQAVPGIYNAQMGNGQPGTSSGIAIAGLVEQGLTAMGEMNGNYVDSRRAVYELLLDLIVEDHLQPNMAVMIGSGDGRREVILNTTDQQTGRPMNMVKDAPVNLGLDDVPSSPAYMMQASQMIGQMIQALRGTPQAGILVPTWVEQTTALGPSRKQVAEDMRRASGLPSAADKQGAEQWRRQQQEQAARAAQLQDAETMAGVALKTAQANKADADALKTLNDVAAMTAANEDQMIEEALMEAIPGLRNSRSSGAAAPANAYPAAAQA